MGSSPRSKRCDIEILSACVVREPNEAFSTGTTLRKDGPEFQRGVARTGASTGPLRRLREVEIARRMPDAAGSSSGAPWDDARSDRHHSEAFSPLVESHSQLDKAPRRPPLVSTTAN
jgi:hypothetical protein